MFIYGIYDSVREAYAPPFVAKNDGEASRMFLQSCRKFGFVKDLSLRRIGIWNDECFEKPVMFVDKCVDVPVQIGESDED